MISFIWRWFTRDLRQKVETLEIDIKDYEVQTLKKNTESLKKDMRITELENILKQQEILNKEEEYWNNKWNHNPIRYKAQDGLYRDVRGLINYPSYIASEIVLFNGLNKETEEETLFAILNWIVKNIEYVGDITTRKTIEFWEDSDITMQRKTGDCEDLSLVFKTLCLVCGIPDYRIKVVAGNVVNPINKEKVVGHAYPIVLYNDDWYTFDCTYHIDKTPLKDRIKAKNDNRYLDIWWTFNKELCFSQKDITMGR